MEQNNPSTEIMHDLSPRFVVYKDGHVERLVPQDTVPPSFDPKTKVQSKDVSISPTLSARMYLPEPVNETKKLTKLPLLIYFHGGGFSLYSSSSTVFHNYLNALVAKANVIALSVDYRVAPENPVPACYEDAWAALQWTAAHAERSGTEPWLNQWSAAHAERSGTEPWLNQWADFDRVFIGGDSAGGNISHNMLDTIETRSCGLLSTKMVITGVILVHPFFGAGQLDRLWTFVCPSTTGKDDPMLNPMADPARMKRAVGSRRVLVCVDKDDDLKERGEKYVETLKESGWEGEVELLVTNGGGHVFQLWDIDCDEAVALLAKIACFINNNNSC